MTQAGPFVVGAPWDPEDPRTWGQDRFLVGRSGGTCAWEPGAQILKSGRTQGRPAGTVGAPRRSCAWTAGPQPPRLLSLSVRHNYIEGTKMLAAYLYEVSQLKD